MGKGPEQNLLHLTRPDANYVGPFLRFGNYNPTNYGYTASVMLVLHPRVQVDPNAFVMTYGPVNAPQRAAAPIYLDTYQGYTFWRFDIALQLINQPMRIVYTIPVPVYGAPMVQKTFIVPSATEPWRWMFYSCNGFHGEKKREVLRGIQPLWRDFFNQHEARPFHVQFGTGDQIYNDPVWDGNCPSLDAWRTAWVHGSKERLEDPFSPLMQHEVEDFYFNHYCRHFAEEIYAEALATVPYVFTWDDHDVFDGWGSYPEYLQHCNVFKNIYGIAKRFYLLFQQHSTEQYIAQLNGTWGGRGGFNEIKQLGASTAVWMLDNRGERTRTRVAAPETYQLARQKLLALPYGVRHLVVVTTVPIVWPKIPLTEEFMASMSGKDKKGIVWTLMNKTGLAKNMMSAFHEPNLLDDLMDHWTADNHQDEKKEMIRIMQEVARTRQIRVTFISGDVHCAAVGRLYSFPKMADEDFRRDFRFMANITSSAMGNEAPPNALMQTYEATNFASDLVGLEPTREKMVKRFRGEKVKFYNRRNYCTVDEFPFDPQADHLNNGCLNFTLRAEHPTQLDKVDIWENFIPALFTTEDKWGGKAT